MKKLDRRQFLATGAAGAAATAAGVHSVASGSTAPAESPKFDVPNVITRGPDQPVVISSSNGRTVNEDTKMSCLERAYQHLRDGSSPTVAVVRGVNEVESNPNDMTVGYGGLPNEHGVVQLDSSVMDGPSHKAGAVAALELVMHPASVALDVLRRTDHVLLVGQGAQDFARAQGHPIEQTLLTERARRIWLRWKESGNPNDDWLDRDQQIRLEGTKDAAALLPDDIEVQHTYGTIHCSAVNEDGDLGAVTTTSGLSFKLPGRVGDSPIIGAGMYVLNEVGAAGATGRGESVIQSCGAFQVVQRMAAGMEPEAACLDVLRWIADHTKREDLLNDRGEPNFNVVMYALRKDGAFGAAVMRGEGPFAYHDGTGPKRKPCPAVFD